MKKISFYILFLICSLNVSAQNISIDNLLRLGKTKDVDKVTNIVNSWGYNVFHVIPSNENPLGEIGEIMYVWGTADNVRRTNDNSCVTVNLGVSSAVFIISWRFQSKQTYLSMKKQAVARGWKCTRTAPAPNGHFDVYTKYNTNINLLFQVMENGDYWVGMNNPW